MKKLLIFFIVVFVPMISADAAIAIKKAAPVATKASAGTDGAASLVPSVIGLVSGVMEMNAKQKELSANCIPSTAEMTFVDNTMKEWAKVGQISVMEIKKTPALNGREECSSPDRGYATDVALRGGAAGMKFCYNFFGGTGDIGMVWAKFPKTGKGTYCKTGVSPCSGNDSVTVSDTYDLFALIDFGPDDYTKAEATMAAKLLNKMESCSNSKINAKKKALWGDFLTNTAGNLGQSTNTGSIMESVGAISSGGVGSLGSIATQFMTK